MLTAAAMKWKFQDLDNLFVKNEPDFIVSN